MDDDDSTFQSLAQRVCAGDEAAAGELVAMYGPHVERVVRMRLSDRRLRRQLDTMDIFQSVFGNFFVRCAMGQIDLKSPGQMRKLLTEMAINRLRNQIEKKHAKKRDVTREQSIESDEIAVAGSSPTASQIVIQRELIEEVRRLLTPEELKIAQLRGEGCSWEEVAQQVGGTADAVRVRYTRAIDRAAVALNLESE